MNHLIAAALAVFAGSIVEGILGFGCSLVWMSFFPLFTTVPDAVGVLQPMHIALNVILLASTWRKCTPKELKPLAMTVPFGIVFGLWIVTSWSSNAIDCVLGVFLIVYTFLKNDDDDVGHGDHDDEETIKVSFDGKQRRKSFLKKTSSNLELDPIEEVDFEEEKKDDNKIPVEEMPHPTLEMSPLIHRHPISAAEAGSAAVPNLNKTGNKHNHTKPNSKLHTPTASKPDMMRNPTAICAGLVGGALMGAFGTGGPAFLVFAKEAGWQKRPELFRANLQLLFFCDQCALLLVAVRRGHNNVREVQVQPLPVSGTPSGGQSRWHAGQKGSPGQIPDFSGERIANHGGDVPDRSDAVG